jgi:hypothetical protein
VVALLLMAVVAQPTATSSVTAKYKEAAILWRRNAKNERADHNLTKAKLELCTATQDEQRLVSVSRKRRVVSVLSAAACAAGTVGAVVGLGLCDSNECRQALGWGGAAVGALGCTVLAISW